jgi:hypothetical protein
MKAETGPEMIDEIAKEPNLDFFFDKNPKELAEGDFRKLIEIERRNRALFIEKKGK